MKKILVINPNTSVEMTKDIEDTINKYKDENIEVTVTCPDFGPRSLESFYDYGLAAFGSYKLIENKKNEYDGVLIACFGDPGLYGMKEYLDCPVVGIAEASIALSTLMGQRFGLLVALDKAVPLMYDMVKQYAMTGRCAAIEPLNISVLDVEKNKAKSVKKLIEVGQKAIDKGAEVLILGCAGMTGLKEEVEEKLGVPVIDPVEYGYKILELMVKEGYGISKIGLYKTPPEKEIVNSEILTE